MRFFSNSIFLLLALQLFSLEVSASNIDKAFHKSAKTLSIGQVMRSAFNLEGYNKSFALVVGIDSFKHFNPLETKNDPIKIKDYLLNEAGFDYVHMLTGDRVTLQRLRKLMVDVFPNLMGRQDRFLFYWSGHGVTDTRNGNNFGHLPLANSKDNEFSSMLDMDSLSQWDKRMPSKQTLYLLDACFSGYAGLTGQSSKKRQSIKQFGIPSRQVMTAGRRGEQTIVLNDRLSSVFTTAVLEGLRGAADYYKDSVITANELNTYVRTRVRGLSKDYKWPKSITPSLGRLRGGGEGEFFFLSEEASVKASSQNKSSSNRTVSPQSGTELGHKHGERIHNHTLPSNGLDHKHGNGLKAKAIRNTFPSVANSRNTVSLKPTMVSIPGGAYTIRCDPEWDHPEIVISNYFSTALPRSKCKNASLKISSKKFKISNKEVTVDQFREFITKTGYKPNDKCISSLSSSNFERKVNWDRPGFPQNGSHPVTCVSYRDVNSYISWISKNTGIQYRLPTHEEFEIAARGGNNNKAYYWGSKVSDGCNYANIADKSLAPNLTVADHKEWRTASCNDRFPFTAPVGSLKPNKFGLYDMFGNVAEWLQDCYLTATKEEIGKARKLCEGIASYKYDFKKGNLWPEFWGIKLIQSSWASFRIGNQIAAGNPLQSDYLVRHNTVKGSQIVMDLRKPYDEVNDRGISFYRGTNEVLIRDFSQRDDLGFRLATN